MHRRGRRLGGLLFAALAFACERPADEAAGLPLNLDFERVGVGEPARPWGWSAGYFNFGGTSGGGIALDTTWARDGRRSLRVALAERAAQPQSLRLQLPAQALRGQDVELRGWTSGRGEVLVSLEAWAIGRVAAIDSLRLADAAAASDAPSTTPTWEPLRLHLAFPADTAVHSLVLTIAADGPADRRFDAFELWVAGRRLLALPVAASVPRRRDLAWLASQSRPLREPEDGDAIGAAARTLFDSIVGGARVVGLGESTHGTREFFQAKHALIDHAVRDLGFRVVAIEANQLDARAMDRFVTRGEGTAESALRALFTVWNTESMRDLLVGLRQYNLQHPERPVRVIGYDMQDHRGPLDSLAAFLTPADADLSRLLRRLRESYGRQAQPVSPAADDATRAAWRDDAERLARGVRAAAPAWLRRVSTRDDSIRVQWAVQSAVLLHQAAVLNESLYSPQRDSLMAENLLWALETMHAGARAVVWAHDVHVSRGGDAEGSFNGGAQMGAYLARALGPDAYRAFSLLTDRGAYTATRSFTNHEFITAEAFVAPPGSIEAALHAVGEAVGAPALLVDLRAARTAPAAAWLRSPRPIRHIGYAAYDYGFEIEVVPPLEFDGAVFIDVSGPSRLLRRR
jgi:erythromycin esterase